MLDHHRQDRGEGGELDYRSDDGDGGLATVPAGSDDIDGDGDTGKDDDHDDQSGPDPDERVAEVHAPILSAGPLVVAIIGNGEGPHTKGRRPRRDVPPRAGGGDRWMRAREPGSRFLRRLPSPVRSRVSRLMNSAFPIFQCALAAGLSWWIATQIFSHIEPFFAPIAAIISWACRSASVGDGRSSSSAGSRSACSSAIF